MQSTRLEQDRRSRLQAARDRIDQSVGPAVYSASRQGMMALARKEDPQQPMQALQGAALEEDRLRQTIPGPLAGLVQLQNRRWRGPATKDGPVFGEEGFGDLEAARAAQPAEEQAVEDGEEGAGYQEQGDDQIQRIRAQAQEDQQGEAEQEAQQQEEQPQGGLSTVDQLGRDQIDILVNAACYLVPVLGHWLWWNLRMVYGSWIAGGNSKMIGPFGWSDVIMVFLPGGKMTGSGVAGKATAQILPDFVAQLTLLFVDLWIATALALSIVVQLILLYALYLIATDLPSAITQFGGLISSFL